MTQPLPEGATQPQFDIGHNVEWDQKEDGPFKITTMAWNSNRSIWVYDLEHPNGTLSPGVLEYELAGRWNPIWSESDKLWRTIEDEAQRQLGLDITIQSVVLRSHLYKNIILVHYKLSGTIGRILATLQVDADGDITPY